MKKKKCCFVCLKAGNISKNCLSQVKCYKCSKQHRVDICHFKKIDSNTQFAQTSHSSNNDSTKEEPPVHFNLPLNTALLQTVISTVEHANIQCKVRILFDGGS